MEVNQILHNIWLLDIFLTAAAIGYVLSYLSVPVRDTDIWKEWQEHDRRAL